MDKIIDVLIIGGGPAGYSAALYAARAGLDTVVVEQLSPGGQMGLTDIIDNYPGFDEGVDGFTLGMKMQQGAERFGAKTVYDQVIAVDYSTQPLRTKTSGSEFLSRTVIIATGVNPRPLGLANEQALVGRGIHYCAHCDGRFYKGKTVMVVGGGNSAVSDALYLSRLAKKVYLVHRRDTLRATKIYHEPLLQAQNVEFLWNSAVTRILADNRVTGAQVTDLHSGDIRPIDCDGIFVSIGRNPAIEFLQGSVAQDAQGYIIADESTKTSVSGVFAAGDIRTKQLRQVITAASDGAVAAHEAELFLSTLTEKE